MQTLNIKRADFHGEWNYTIAPSSQNIKAVDSRQALTSTSRAEQMVSPVSPAHNLCRRLSLRVRALAPAFAGSAVT